MPSARTARSDAAGGRTSHRPRASSLAPQGDSAPTHGAGGVALDPSTSTLRAGGFDADSARLRAAVSRPSEVGHAGILLDPTTSTLRTGRLDADAARLPNYPAVRDSLTDMFRPHLDRPGLSQDQKAALQDLIGDRAQTLSRMGYTRESLEQLMLKGTVMDRLADAGAGAVKSLGFGAASAVVDFVPGATAAAHAHPAKTGAIAGAISQGMDSGSSSIVSGRLSDRKWMEPSRADLHPAMLPLVDATAADAATRVKEFGIAFQTYSARNVVRLAADGAAAAVGGPKAKALTDGVISAAGSPVAGSLAYLALNQFDKNAQRIGPEYLLGRNDWQDQIQALEQATHGGQALNGAARVANAALDVLRDPAGTLGRVVTDGLSPAGLGQAASLVGGFAGVVAATSAVAKAMVARGYDAADPKVVVAQQAVSLLMSAPVYAAWTSAAAALPDGAAVRNAVSNLFQRAGLLSAGDEGGAGPAAGAPQQAAATAPADVDIEQALAQHEARPAVPASPLATPAAAASRPAAAAAPEQAAPTAHTVVDIEQPFAQPEARTTIPASPISTPTAPATRPAAAASSATQRPSSDLPELPSAPTNPAGRLPPRTPPAETAAETAADAAVQPSQKQRRPAQAQ
jgi:hypothetical protein